jgi:hypothetical protein
MLIGIGVFGLYSYMTKPSTPNRVYYEADATGRLVKVGQPSTQSPPTPRLFKPEPLWLIDRSAELALTKAQIAAVREIGKNWELSKGRFKDRFRSHSELVSNRGKKTASASELHDLLGDYSALSREFDRQRSNAWLKSIKLLSIGQREKLELLVEEYR